MKMLYPKIDEADVMVIVSPVYVDGITGPMKDLIDRMIHLIDPFVELNDGQCQHPLRGEVKPRKYVLVSSCGFWEKDSFDHLLVFMKILCSNISFEFSGALLRPHAGAMLGMIEMGEPIGDIFEAAKEAGRQLVKEQKISQETLDIVSRELLPREIFIQMTNQNFQQTLDALEK